MTAAGDSDEAVGERQVPFFCPYCGEEELRPAGSKAGDWECRSCSRGFTLRFTGVTGAASAADAGAKAAAAGGAGG
jgi:ribosomal protein L37AE/L43A